MHVVQRNRPRYVILSEDEYQRLAPKSVREESVWDYLADRPWQGNRTKQDIDNQIAEERASWNLRHHLLGGRR